MIICKRLDPPDDRLQVAISSRKSIAKGRILWMNIGKMVHSIPVSITATLARKCHIFHLVLLLYSCLGGLCHTLQVQKKAKITQTNIAKYRKKRSCDIFQYLEKHAITVICDIPRFRWLRTWQTPKLAFCHSRMLNPHSMESHNWYCGAILLHPVRPQNIDNKLPIRVYISWQCVMSCL